MRTGEREVRRGGGKSMELPSEVLPSKNVTVPVGVPE
jgi:hypothetical protein